jgi:4-alpha-glucanotransferase
MLRRCAGVLIPLFSLRTGNDFGRGEIGGLREMGEFALAMGHRLIQLLPIDETAAGENSPYSALSVFAIDPAYICVRLLPGVSPARWKSARRAARGSDGHFDPIRAAAIKRDLLEHSYRHFRNGGDTAAHAAFDRFVDAERDWIEPYALFRALKEEFGLEKSWESWPPALKHREARTCNDAALQLADKIAMFQFFQFIAQRQWRDVRDHLGRRGLILGGDLAFSPARESAEVWAHQEMFDLTRSVGAPPDEFSATGQRWGLPMPQWSRMRADAFGLLRARVRRAAELYDLLRIDHVVGLFRTYGYPLDDEIGGVFDPLTVDEQRAQGIEIMRAILAEANSMQIVAEDLGLIPGFVRSSLAALGVPGYKVVRWEKRMNTQEGAATHFLCPADYPELSLATTGTHDTETLGEWWAEISAADRRRLVADFNICGRVDCDSCVMDERTLDALLESLYASPARIVTVPIQDLFGWKDRINLPGTIGERNWTWRLPFDLEQVGREVRLRARLARLREIAERTRRFDSAGG